MSRRRYVSTKISTDKDLTALARIGGDFAVLLYTWMIPHAEDDCSLPNDAETIANVVVPGRRDKTYEDVEYALQAMADLGLIWRFSDEGILRFPPETFYKYQAYISSEKRWQGHAPTLAQKGDDQRTSAQKAASVSLYSSVSPSVSSSPKGNTTGATSGAPVSQQPSRQRTDKPRREPHPDTAALVDALYYPLKERAALPTSKSWYMRQQITAQTMLGVRPLGDWQACIAWGLSHHYHADKCLSLAYVDGHVWPQYAQRDIAGGARAAPSGDLRQTVNAYAAWAERQENGGVGNDTG